MHCGGKLSKNETTKANSSSEHSESHKKCDEESNPDLMFVCDKNLTNQNTMTSSDKKVNRWLKNNFTTIKEIEKCNAKEHQKRPKKHFVVDFIDRINVSKVKVKTLKRVEQSLNKRIAKWMKCVPTEEVKEFESEHGGLSAGSAEKEDENVYDGSEEDNHESDSEVNSRVLKLVNDLDYLGSVSQHGSDINVSSDHTTLTYPVSHRSYLNYLTSYSSSDSSDMDLVFYENVKYYPEWLVKKKRNIGDPIIISKSKSTEL